MIKVASYIKNAFSMNDVNLLAPAIEAALHKGDSVVLDFTGVKYYTTLFFNNAITKYVVSLGLEKYQEMFKLINLSDVGKTTYEHSLTNAISYYETPLEKRSETAQIITRTLEEIID